MIYFMQPQDGGPIKIGCTKDLHRRQRELEFVYKRTLVVLATMDGSRKEESKIHKMFSAFRIGRTEQFRPDPELFRFIGLPTPASSHDSSVSPMGFARPVNVDITPETHRKLRLAAAQDEKSMAEFARDALIFVLSQREKAK